MTGKDQRSIVFVHAHPDDEAIFTGGTIRLLAERGCRVCVVLATDGSCGEEGPIDDLALAERRAAEVRDALARLGCDDVVELGHRDSGMAGSPDNHHPRALTGADLSEEAERVAEVCRRRGVDTVVGYEPGGMYGHPDHRAVHRIARRAASLAGAATLYEATVDREYLHFVDTHLVELAALSGPVPYDALVGSATAEIPTHVDVGPALDAKREAMLAHASQIDADLVPDGERFAGVYGYEWYLREGEPGVLDALGRAETGAPASATLSQP